MPAVPNGQAKVDRRCVENIVEDSIRPRKGLESESSTGTEELVEICDEFF